jgi:hypothetical protein
MGGVRGKSQGCGTCGARKIAVSRNPYGKKYSTDKISADKKDPAAANALNPIAIAQATGATKSLSWFSPTPKNLPAQPELVSLAAFENEIGYCL